MYENLIGEIIDKSKPEFEDFPPMLDGQIYKSGDAIEGWYTFPNFTIEEKQQLVQEEENKKAREYLSSTDWYLIRLQETGIEVPIEVSRLRQEAREMVI